jgi:flagellin
MLSILNNVAATSAQNQMEITNTNMQKTLEQLSSGQRINSGADDAAGLSIADGLNANIAALNQSSQNATTGVGLLQVADGALAQVTSLLNRAVTLATEAANSGLTTDQHTALNNEFTSIKTEIDNIGQTTTYNGSAIFGSGSGAGNQTQATNPNTIVTTTLAGTANGAEVLKGNLVVDAGGKQVDTFKIATTTTLASFVNAINTQSVTNQDGIQASVNSNNQLVLTDTLDRGDISTDPTLTTLVDNAVPADVPGFANQGLNNLNVREGAAGLTASQIVTDTGTWANNGGTAGDLGGGTGNSTTGTAATATLTLTDNLAAGSTLNIGNTTYTLVASGATGNEINLGTTAALTVAAIKQAITNNGGDTSVSAANSGDVLTLTSTLLGTGGNTVAANGVLLSAGGTDQQDLIVNAGGASHTFQIAAGSTLADVINTINNQGTGITASQDAATGKLVLTDTQDNGDISVSDNVNGGLVNNLSGEPLGGTITTGFTNPELMTSSNTMSVFLSDSTQTGTSTVDVALNTFNSANMGVAGVGIANNDLTTTTDAATALTAINAAISNVSALRGNLGSGVNQLQAATNVIGSQTQNLTTASSNITSADIGQTVANMTQYSILSQTGMAAMAQADQMQKGILTLLQG